GVEFSFGNSLVYRYFFCSEFAHGVRPDHSGWRGGFERHKRFADFQPDGVNAFDYAFAEFHEPRNKPPFGVAVDGRGHVFRFGPVTPHISNFSSCFFSAVCPLALVEGSRAQCPDAAATAERVFDRSATDRPTFDWTEVGACVEVYFTAKDDDRYLFPS